MNILNTIVSLVTCVSIVSIFFVLMVPLVREIRGVKHPERYWERGDKLFRRLSVVLILCLLYILLYKHS